MLTIKPEYTRYYKDIDLSFTANALTKDVDKFYDVKAVKQALKVLLLTSYYERLYHPEIGSPLAGLLFEPVDGLTAAAMEKSISQLIVDREPRVALEGVIVTPNEDMNSYALQINFFVVGVDAPEQTFVSTLYRAR